jgi:TM2 domain-containing membrane protein YozV
VAAICAILIGTMGIHKFIMGYNKEGIIYLAVNLLIIPVFGVVTCGIGFSLYGITSMVPVIEGIIYLTKSDEEFVRTYQENKKAWF